MQPTTSTQTNSGIQPYAGTWGKAQQLHLLRRTLFGVTNADLAHFQSYTLSAMVTELLTVSSAVPSPPINNYNTPTSIDPNIAAGQTWITGPTNGSFSTQRKNSYRAWWVGQMLNQDRTILEKMVLFWHNHFSTEVDVVGDPILSYNHNTLLRANAVGNFKTLTKLVTTDPAMLTYLNGAKNTKTAPDENYGRELQELFTVGKDLPTYFSEDDVKAAARTLTGWRINNATYTSYFDVTRHDTTNKTFSSFYANTVITGQSGATAGDMEVDALLAMIFAQQEVSKYFCRKLYRFFVYYKISAQAETDVIEPLAALLRSNNYDIAPVLQTLFTSQHFYDALNLGCVIKPGVDFEIGFFRAMGVVFPASSDYVRQYKMWYTLWTYLYAMQQGIGSPPNVAGWPAYYQLPSYHELWINTNTITTRNQVTDSILVTGYSSGGYKLIADTLAVTATFATPADPDALVADALALFHTLPVSATVQASLKAILLSNQTSNHYWTDAWNAYVANPTDAMLKSTCTTRLIPFYKYLFDLAEYQLS